MDGSIASMLVLASARYPRRNGDLCIISFLPLQGEAPKAEGSCSVKPYLVPAPAGPPQSLRDSSPYEGEQIRACSLYFVMKWMQARTIWLK